MAFRNFVVAGSSRDVSFVPNKLGQGSFGLGSPSASVNNNDVDAMSIVPLTMVEPCEPTRAEGDIQVLKNVTDFC